MVSISKWYTLEYDMKHWPLLMLFHRVEIFNELNSENAIEFKHTIFLQAAHCLYKWHFVLIVINSFGTENAIFGAHQVKQRSCWSPGDCVREACWRVSTTFAISKLKNGRKYKIILHLKISTSQMLPGILLKWWTDTPSLVRFCF